MIFLLQNFLHKFVLVTIYLKLRKEYTKKIPRDEEYAKFVKLSKMRINFFCLACDEVAKARHRCYFPASALVFLKLYISESINDSMTKISMLIVRDMKLPTNQMTLVLDLLCMVQ